MVRIYLFIVFVFISLTVFASNEAISIAQLKANREEGTDSQLKSSNEDKISQYKKSWTARALHLQRQIDLNAPINQATFLGTHNSYNSKSYQIPFIRYLDPNHTLSLYEQLELGIRSLELDAHWYLGREGKKEILLCHGMANHMGCSVFDRPIREGLIEIQKWLTQNPNEIILLYIDRSLDGHEPRLGFELDKYLGEFIYKPALLKKPGSTCFALPQSITKKIILQAGKQLIIVVKGCDGEQPAYLEQDQFKTIWNDVVFTGIGDMPLHPFNFIDSSLGNDFKAHPQCGESIFAKDSFHASLWRIFEDRTNLSNVESSRKQITPSMMQELLRCHINWPSIDMLEIVDARLTAAVWSWALGYPIDNLGACAYYEKGIGFKNGSCEQQLDGYACEQEKTNQFTIVSVRGMHADGDQVCQTVAGSGWRYSVPVNAAQMQSLKKAAADLSVSTVGLNYLISNEVNHV